MIGHFDFYALTRWRKLALLFDVFIYLAWKTIFYIHYSHFFYSWKGPSKSRRSKRSRPSTWPIAWPSTKVSRKHTQIYRQIIAGFYYFLNFFTDWPALKIGTAYFIRNPFWWPYVVIVTTVWNPAPTQKWFKLVLAFCLPYPKVHKAVKDYWPSTCRKWYVFFWKCI